MPQTPLQGFKFKQPPMTSPRQIKITSDQSSAVQDVLLTMGNIPGTSYGPKLPNQLSKKVLTKVGNDYFMKEEEGVE